MAGAHAGVGQGRNKVVPSESVAAGKLAPAKEEEEVAAAGDDGQIEVVGDNAGKDEAAEAEKAD